MRAQQHVCLRTVLAHSPILTFTPHISTTVCSHTWCFLSVTSTGTTLPEPWFSTIHFMPCCTNSSFGVPLGCDRSAETKIRRRENNNRGMLS